jgi:hypothetical protein
MTKANINENAVSSDTTKIQILNHLMTKAPLTVLEGMILFRTIATSQRVSDLIKEGFPIKKRMIQVESGKWVAQYYL